MKKKKIAFVIGSLTAGGAERVITTLSNALIIDWSITIITFRNIKPFYRLNENIKVIKYPSQSKKPTNIFASFWLNFNLIRFLNRTFKEEGIELAIGFITMSNIMTLLASKLSGIPSVISERNNPIQEATPPIWKFLRKYLYKYATVLVVQTEAVKDYYIKYIPESQIAIIPNPISKNLSLKRNFKTTKKEIILTVGRLNPQKNQRLLINAFTSLPPSNWKLIIVGEGSLKTELNDLIVTSNMVDRIVLKRPCEKIYEFYNNASIFAFSSNFEGFPNAMLEALHFGIPVVSTNCQYGPSELINEGVNGFLTSLNNKEEFQNRLKFLMDNPEIRKQMGNEAKKSTEDFDEKIIVAKWSGLLQRTIDSSIKR